MIILRLLLLLTNLHLKLLSTQGTGADKLVSTQRVNERYFGHTNLSTIWLVLIRSAYFKKYFKVHNNVLQMFYVFQVSSSNASTHIF